MRPYILLTPGPLTTSETVKEAMLTDWCTWDADYNVHIVEEYANPSLHSLQSKPMNILPFFCKAVEPIVWKPL